VHMFIVVMNDDLDGHWRTSCKPVTGGHKHPHRLIINH
jgi:hypothetical protein